MRLRFVGTTEVVLDVDPKEFTGMNVAAVATELENMVAAQHPGVDVPFNDVVLEANRVATEAVDAVGG